MSGDGDPNSNPNLDDEIRAEARFIRVVYKGAFTAAIALTIATMVVCCFAIASVLQSKCAGEPWLEGYRVGDFLVLPVIDAFIIFMFIRGSGIGREDTWRRIDDPSDIHALPEFQFGSIRITHRMRISFMVFFGLAAIVAIMLRVAITHHQTILTDCRLAVAPH